MIVSYVLFARLVVHIAHFWRRRRNVSPVPQASRIGMFVRLGFVDPVLWMGPSTDVEQIEYGTISMYFPHNPVLVRISLNQGIPRS